jgi:ribonuclease R
VNIANNTVTGPIMIRGKGTGFLAHPDLTQDIVIERDRLGLALDGDIVEVTYTTPRAGERAEGTVVRVLERVHRELIGIVKERTPGDHTSLYLQPDNHRIHVRPTLPPDTTRELGMKVVVTITDWTDPKQEPQASITEVLGRAGDHETEMRAIIRGGGFALDFPEPVAKAAEDIHASRDEIFREATLDPKRRDMRSVTTMTIDPVDAKDFDDALSLEALTNGNYSIGIHIADVSHYVREGDAIDQEAKERGTSVYLVDRVIPMLPEVLSNDLCSLRPNEDRLAFSAVFELTPQAEIVGAWYGQTIIHSNKRFSYEEAQTVLDRGEGPFLSELTTLMTLGRILRKERYREGAIAFEQPEVKFELDERGAPIRVYAKVRTETMMMIEDFMLLANREVATHIYDLAKESGRNLAFIYRIHDTPNPDKIEELALFLRVLGYEFETQKGIVTAKNVNKLLAEVEGKPEANLIKTATIRSMAKAVYSTKNIGHFGLAFKYYTHFTSPIRRYPDLLAHRLLRRHLDGSGIKGTELAHFEKIAIQSSQREMEAVSAERDSIKFKQVEYMQNRVGHTFDGLITGVSDWGVYVQDKASLTEGMVRLAAIKGDYYEHDPKNYRVKGQKTGKIYRLGDEVKIKLVKVLKDERQLDFELVA